MPPVFARILGSFCSNVSCHNLQHANFLLLSDQQSIKVGSTFVLLVFSIGKDQHVFANSARILGWHARHSQWESGAIHLKPAQSMQHHAPAGQCHYQGSVPLISSTSAIFRNASENVCLKAFQQPRPHGSQPSSIAPSWRLYIDRHLQNFSSSRKSP